MRSKLVGLLVVLALLLGTFGTAFAQDATAANKPYCGDLATGDCALLQGAQDAMMGVSSYKASGTYDASLTGIPGLPAKDINVNVGVDGAFSFDEAAMTAAKALAGLPQQELVAALAKNPTQLTDLVKGMKADLTLNAKMTPELAQAFSAQAGVTIPDTGKLGLMLVDGVLYVDASDFASLGAPKGWIGVPVGELLDAQVKAGALDQAAAQMEAAKSEPSMAASMAVQAMLMGQVKEFQKFLTVKRGTDADVNGAKVAVFDTTPDLAALVASPEFANVLKQLADSGVFAQTGLTAADIEKNLPMLGMMAPMIFQGLKISNQVSIGADDKYVYNTSDSLNWDLSSLIQMAAMSGQLPAGISATSPVSVSLSANVTNSDFNKEQTITAPTDAMMIPVEALQQSSTTAP